MRPFKIYKSLHIKVAYYCTLFIPLLLRLASVLSSTTSASLPNFTFFLFFCLIACNPKRKCMTVRGSTFLRGKFGDFSIKAKIPMTHHRMRWLRGTGVSTYICICIFNIKSYPETTTTKSMMFHRFRM